jgi:hypothetical protein
MRVWCLIIIQQIHVVSDDDGHAFADRFACCCRLVALDYSGSASLRMAYIYDGQGHR